MTNVRMIHLDWYSQRPPRFNGGPQLAFQGDHLSNMVVFDNAPNLPNYYLLVKMKLTKYGKPVELPPIMLEGPYWLIPNYYTNICQLITYQVCSITDSGDYVNYSAEFKGTILPVIKYDADLISQTNMFDPYKAILDKRVNDLILASGDIQVDSELKNDSGNPVQNRVIKAAIDETLGMAKVTLTSSNVSGDYTNANTFPRNQIVIVAASAIGLITNYPKGYNTGGTVITLNGYTGANGAVQIVHFFNNFYARRICVSDTWSDWEYPEIFYRTYKVRADGTGDFGSVVSAIRNTMTSGLASPFYRYIIDIGEGTFDLTGTTDLVLNGTIDQRGLFVMPYVTIRGKGKNKTFLTYYYNGSNDTIMSMVSGLNMAYESALEDLTLSVRNIRYTVHSDNALSSEQSDFDNTLLNNNKIVLKNVRLEHLGFSSELTPTYKVPAAWGGGSWNATDRVFIDCDFISKEVCGFLNHDRVGITKPSHFTFKNCNFITYNSDVRAQAVTGYSSCALISWGSGIKTPVSFENCKANKFVALTVVTNYNSDAVIDYDVNADNDLFIIESTTNDAHLNDNFRTSGCIESVCAGADITAYDPVSKNRLYWVHGYNSADAMHGIALNSCAQNEICVVQTSGFVALPLLTSETFTDGAYIGYANGEWVEDTSRPIIRVIGGNVGKII